MTENYELNPDIRKIVIGIHDPKEVKVYPISLADEQDLLDDFLSVFVSFKDITDNTNDYELIQLIKNKIFENLENILLSVLPEDYSLDLKEITNTQALALCDIIYEVNFEFLLKKKGVNFLKKMKELFLSMNLSPLSSEEQEATD